MGLLSAVGNNWLPQVPVPLLALLGMGGGELSPVVEYRWLLLLGGGPTLSDEVHLAVFNTNLLSIIVKSHLSSCHRKESRTCPIDRLNGKCSLPDTCPAGSTSGRRRQAGRRTPLCTPCQWAWKVLKSRGDPALAGPVEIYLPLSVVGVACPQAPHPRRVVQETVIVDLTLGRSLAWARSGL